MVAVLFAEGFEEIEALAPVDILRRAGQKVAMCGVGGKEIVGSHGITVAMDMNITELDFATVDCVVLPGGMPGTLNLENSDAVQRLIDHCAEHNKIIAAICAAPSILAHKGLLSGKTATVYPDFQDELIKGGANLGTEYLCKDGSIITARGMGMAIEFGFAIAAALTSSEKAEEIWIKACVQCECGN